MKPTATLQIDKAHHELGWKPQWTGTTVKRTVRWYQSVENGETALKARIRDIEDYGQSSDYKKVFDMTDSKVKEQILRLTREYSRLGS